MPYLHDVVHVVVSMLVTMSVPMTLHYSSYSSIDSDDCVCFCAGSTQELRVALTRSSGRKRLEAETQRAYKYYSRPRDTYMSGRSLRRDTSDHHACYTWPHSCWYLYLL